MAVYRFRIIFEDQEDTVREIEILGKQTFEDFHRSIQQAIGFDSSKDASFFMSDDYWRKGQEITSRVLVDDDDDDDDYRRPSKKMKAKRLSEAKIADHIDDPHQKIVYVFDPAAKWTLLIELFKILSDDPKANYPRTVKSVGVAPRQYKQVIAPPVDEDDDVEDEDDKLSTEKLFVAEEGYDDDAADGAEEEKLEGGEEDAPADGEDSEESEDGEEASEDFDMPESDDY